MRVFIAVDCNIRERLKELQQEILKKVTENRTNLNPVSVNNMHFTLSFLGEIKDQELENVKKVISEIRFSKIDISYNSIGVFPSMSFVKVIWVGIDNKGSESLKRLQVMVSEKLKQIGLQTDPRFVPHLTIFRIKSRISNIIDICNYYNGQVFGQDIIDKLYVKKSILNPNGPVYSNLLTVNALNE